MIINVNTGAYRRSWGKGPSGQGHWAFQIDTETHFFTGKYTSAKAEAVKVAMAKGKAEKSQIVYISVLS